MVSINSFSTLSIIVNTTLKYYYKQALNKKLKLMGGTMNFFLEKVTGSWYMVTFSYMVPWAMNIFEIFVEPSGPLTYILNVGFVKGTSTDI